MRTQLAFVAALTMVVGAAADGSRAQEMHYLSNQINARLDASAAQSRAWFEELSDEPADVRQAALELSTKPDWVVRLAASAPVADVPAELQVHARVLLTRPELLKRMSENVVSIGLLGQVFAAQKAPTLQMLDRMAEDKSARRAAAAEAWSKRLLTDPAAATQFRQLRDSRAAPVGAPQVEMSLPTADEARRILASIESHCELAGQVVDQWERERNPDGFRAAVDEWYARHRDLLPDRFPTDGAARTAILKELVRFEQELASQTLATGGTPIDRKAFLASHDAEFPKLAEVREAKIAARLAARPLRVAGGPWTGGSGGGSATRSSGRSGRSSSSGGFRSPTRSARTASSEGVSGFGGTTGRSNSRFGGNRSNNGFGGNRGGGFGNSGFGNSGGGFGNSGFGGGGGFGNSGFGGAGGFGNSGFGGGGIGNSGFGGMNSGNLSRQNR